MSRRRVRKDVEASIPVVRGLIVYLWLLILFGSVILIVQASMEEKKIRYRLTDRNSEKKDLLEEIRKVDNRIAELESYRRIGDLVEEQLPYLGPPRHPAIVIAVPGLTSPNLGNVKMVYVFEDRSWLTRFRQQWKKSQLQVMDYLQSLIE